VQKVFKLSRHRNCFEAFFRSRGVPLIQLNEAFDAAACALFFLNNLNVLPSLELQWMQQSIERVPCCEIGNQISLILT